MTKYGKPFRDKQNTSTYEQCDGGSGGGARVKQTSIIEISNAVYILYMIIIPFEGAVVLIFFAKKKKKHDIEPLLQRFRQSSNLNVSSTGERISSSNTDTERPRGMGPAAHMHGIRTEPFTRVNTHQTGSDRTTHRASNE